MAEELTDDELRMVLQALRMHKDRYRRVFGEIAEEEVPESMVPAEKAEKVRQDALRAGLGHLDRLASIVQKIGGDPMADDYVPARLRRDK